MVSCSFLESCHKNGIMNKHYCVDINDSALELTEKLIKSFYLEASFINSNLFDNVDNDLKLDLIFFNPVLIC